MHAKAHAKISEKILDVYNRERKELKKRDKEK